VASELDDVDFAINVSGASVPLLNQEMWSTGNELAARGYSERALATTMKVMHMLISTRPLIRSGLIPLGDLFIWFEAKDPYIDPTQFLYEVEQPVLIACGTHDEVVPARDSAAIVEGVLEDYGHPLSRVFVYVQGKHGVRLESGEWAPGHIETMRAWVLGVLQGETIESKEIAYDMFDRGLTTGTDSAQR
jgi:hypothetical protein